MGLQRVRHNWVPEHTLRYNWHITFCHFILLVISFAVQSFLFWWVSFVWFSFVACSLNVIQIIIDMTNVKELSPYVFLWEFYSFRSYVYVFNPFQVTFHEGCEVQLHSCMWMSHFSSTIYWRGYPFPVEYSWLFLSIMSKYSYAWIYFLESRFYFIGWCVYFYSSSIPFWLS